jgi:branched-chain amino acid transport system ATP-binding protein
MAPLLEIRNVTRFFGGLRAVYDLTQSVPEGQLFGLIGPNGAGKTTVFNLVCGFYAPSEGDILFRGQSIVGLRPHQITARGMARTFQNIRLWNSLTVFDNLCISQHSQLGYGFLKAAFRTRSYRESEAKVRKTAESLLDTLNLKHYANELPKNLPYGMQRRLEIGRALATHPKLLLLDEPAAGMNPGEIDQLIELIRWIRDKFKLTIWLIEHHMQVVMGVCEVIKVLDFGETICTGSPETVRQNKRVIQAYLGDDETAEGEKAEATS